MNRFKKPKIQLQIHQGALSINRDNFLHDVLVPTTAAAAERLDPVFQAMRFARATAPPPAAMTLPEFVKHMQELARIANAISLQSELIGGKVTDAIIKELLHMHPLTPNDLINLKPADVNKVLTPMKTLNFPETITIEKLYEKMTDVIKENINLTEFTSLTKKDEYVQALEGIVNDPVQETDIEAPENSVSDLKTKLEKVKNYVSDAGGADRQKLNREGTELATISPVLVDVENAFKSYGTVNTLVNSLKDLVEKSSFVKLLEDENKWRSNHGFHTEDSTQEDQAKANFDSFESLCTLLYSNEQILSNLKSVANVISSGPKPGDHTAGFPNGVQDLEQLTASVDAKWFKDVFNGTQTPQNLKKGLLPLDGFKTSLKDVETAWQPAKSHTKHTTDVLTLQFELVDQGQSSNVLSTKTNAMKQCQTDYQNSKVIAFPTSELELITKLNKKIDELGSFDYTAKLSDLSTLKTILDFTAKNTDDLKGDAAPEVVRQLKALPQLQDTIGLLKEFPTKVTILKEILASSKKMITGIQDKMATITSYHTKATQTTFEAWNNCLKQNVGEDGGKRVSKMINSIRSLRVLNLQHVLDTEKFFDIVTGSTDKIKRTNATAAAVKANDRESQALNLLTNSTGVAKDLGLAVQGMMVIQKIDNSRPLTGDIQDILTAANTHFATNSVDNSNIQSLSALKTNLNTLLTEIDTFKSTAFKNFNATKLAGHGPVFLKASAINPVTVPVDLDDLKKSVEKLEEKVTNALQQPQLQPQQQQELQLQKQQLQDVLSSLNTLKGLNLNFASYKFNTAPGALNKLDLFFAKAEATISATPPPIVQGGSGGRGGNGGGGRNGAQQIIVRTEAPDHTYTIILAGSIVGGVIIFGIVAFSIYRWNKKRVYKQRIPKWFHATNELVEKLEMSPQNMVTPRKLFSRELGLFNQMNTAEQGAAANFDERRKRRYQTIYRTETTAVRLDPLPSQKKNPFIHANVMQMRDSTWILAQGPLDGTEPHSHIVKGRDIEPGMTKENTLETHWQMVDQKDVALIIQLCNFEEEGSIKCAHYYPEEEGKTAKHGCYTVKTVKNSKAVQKEFKVHPDQYSLVTVEFEYNSVKKSVDILRFFGWPDHGAPKEPEPPLEMLAFSEKYGNKTVLVHCSAGIGRTGTLVGIKKGIEMCESGQKPGMNSILVAIRECRCQAVQNELQIAYLMFTISRGLLNKTDGKSFVRSHSALRWYYNQLMAGWWYQKKIDSKTNLVVKDKKGNDVLEASMYETEEEAKKDIDAQHAFVKEKEAEWQKDGGKKVTKKGGKGKKSGEKSKEKTTKSKDKTGSKTKSGPKTGSASATKSVEKSGQTTAGSKME